MPENEQVEAVLFDWSGVFTTRPFGRFPDIEAEHGWAPGSLERVLWGDYSEVGGSHPWHRLERGEITLDEYWTDLPERCEAELGCRLSTEDFLEFMRSDFAVHHVLVHRVRALRGRYRTALCTNNAREYGDVWRTTIPVDELFDAIVDSCEVGARKPEPAYFERALEVVGVPATRAVFLDDMACNVEGARAMGIRAILVTDIGRALEDLDAVLDGS